MPCDVENSDGWLQAELRQIDDVNQRAVIEVVARDLTSFVRWTREALLLWPGCDTTHRSMKSADQHSFIASGTTGGAGLLVGKRLLPFRLLFSFSAINAIDPLVVPTVR